MQTGLEGKPWYQGLLIGLVLGGVLFFLGYWLYIGPIKDQIAMQEGHLGQLQQKIQEGLSAQSILPARRNTPDLLRRIRALAEQGDFNLKDFKPEVLTDKEFYSEWPISVDLDGTYHNLALLFDRIGRFSRIINITDLTIAAITPTKANPHTISAQFIAKTFVYKEPDNNPPAAAHAKPGRPVPPPGAPSTAPPRGGAGGGE
jgi:type IV pilus assembly protein PilO